MSICPHCGCEIEKRPRSLQDHRRLFGLLRAAFMHWPERHPFQPTSEEHLRAWLLIEAGHHDVEFIAYPDDASEAVKALFRLAIEATHAACHRKRGYASLRVSAGGVEVFTAKSINWSQVSQREFGPIRDAIQDIIETALGVSAEQLLTERAA